MPSTARYCAAERWAVTQALSRFGTWKHLGATSSSSSDVDPSTQTLSFHGATFTSQYVSFTGVEQTTNQPNSSGTGYTPLDTLSKADAAIVNKFDAPPYVSKSSSGSIPFVNFGGMWLVSGASYDPAVLKGLTHAQIAAAMHDPTSDVAKAIDGTADVERGDLQHHQPRTCIGVQHEGRRVRVDQARREVRSGA